MRKFLSLIFIAFLFLQGCVTSPTPETQFQNLIDSIYAANPSSVGIMVHVEAPLQGISWSGASGHPGKDMQSALEADQPALIASNIKTYVSAAILRLVEETKLSVEYPIKDFLTDKR